MRFLLIHNEDQANWDKAWVRQKMLVFNYNTGRKIIVNQIDVEIKNVGLSSIPLSLFSSDFTFFTV